MAASGRVLVILNPIAGYGRSGKLIPQVTERLRQNGIEFQIVLTERRGHAQELAATTDLDDFGVVASTGGDGTFSEVVNGLMARFGGRVPLGIKVAAIPMGTGNDFLWGSHLSTKWTDAVDALKNPVTHPVDVFEVTDAAGLHRYAANCVGIGFDAYVARRVAQLGTGKIGPLGYMVEAFRGLLHFNPEASKVQVSGGPAADCERMWLLAVTNSEKYGGGMQVCPGARFDDGLLNYALLHGVPRRNLVGLILLVRSGKHVGKPGVVMGSAAEVSVRVSQGFPCHVDGDTVDVTYPVTVKVLPGVLPFVVGPGSGYEPQRGGGSCQAPAP
jgi:YegS/Rv2252/BmrU family lipid kinase